MKQILHSGFLWLAVALLATTACVEPIANDNPYKASVPVRFKVVTSDNIPQTKSTDGLIAGTDAAVTALYLYCFDENGRYLGRFSATEVTSTYATNEPNDEGTFNGSVPPATARIHFVANADIPVGNDKIGMTEEEIFHGQNASTWGLTACRRDQIAYWGYHKEATAKAMEELFDPNNSSTTTIYLLRDRARIEALTPGTYFEQVNPNYDPAKVKWTIYNGMSTGYVAPYDATNQTFEGYYSSTTGGLSAQSVLTPQANPARDKTDEDDMLDFVTGSYLYAFEDVNYIEGNNVSQAIRIIVRVEVKNSDQVLYFPVRITDKEGDHQLQVKRGHRYQLSLGYLPVGLGHPTFEDAAKSTSFANGALVTIPVVVPEVSDGRFELRVDYKLGEDQTTSTSALYESWPGGNSVVRIPFQFKRTDGAAVVSTDFNFEAEWTSDSQTVADTMYAAGGSGVFHGIKIITDNITSGGDGYVEIKLNEVEVGKLKSGTIRLFEKTHKLERNIYVYSIQWFRYRDLQLVPKTAAQGGGYRLYLQLPNGARFSEYPDGLYPIKIKMATKSLRPAAVYNGSVSDAGVPYQNMRQKDNVVFGVEVKTTKPGEVSGITDWGTWTNAQKDWYYQGTAANPECWNFWYIYTIDYKEGPCYWIDFTDIRGSYAAANQSSDVGLYFRIEFFGDGTGSGATGQFGGHSLPSEALMVTEKTTWVDPDSPNYPNS